MVDISCLIQVSWFRYGYPKRAIITYKPFHNRNNTNRPLKWLKKIIQVLTLSLDLQKYAFFNNQT